MMIERFEKLLGVAPDEATKVQLYRLRDELKLADDDPVWLIFFGLEHNRALLAEAPRALAQAVDQGLKKLQNNLNFVGDFKASLTALQRMDLERLCSDLDHSRSRIQRVAKFSAALIPFALLAGVLIGAVGGAFAAYKTSEKQFFEAARARKLDKLEAARVLQDKGWDFFPNAVVTASEKIVDVWKNDDGRIVVQIKN